MKPRTKASTANKATVRKPRSPRTAPAPAANPQAGETSGGTALTPPAVPEVVSPPAAPSPAAVPPEASKPSATVAATEMVQLGAASGVASRMPIGDVLGLLGQPVLDRIDMLLGHASISGLAERMRATDGRCAPVYFTHEGKDGPLIFNHGAEAIAAAVGLGDNDLYVVRVPSDEAEALQDHLVVEARKREAETTKR